MKAAIVTFPGSNCDRDLSVAFEKAGFETIRLWHKETEMPKGVDIIGVPGGFSFGDYLRCGAIAARSPVATIIKNHAQRGGYVIGICNGFQILTETKLLPGTLMRNQNLKFICKTVKLRVETPNSAFTSHYEKGQTISIPIAHHDGNYTIDPEGLARLQSEDRIAFRYDVNPNGSTSDIAGVFCANRRILGMMPHPERAIENEVKSSDGALLFKGLLDNFAVSA